MFEYLTKKRIASSIAIAVICLVGDKNSKPVKDVDLAAAICDNVTHGFVGMVIWSSVLVFKSDTNRFDFCLQIILCGICSSLIDVDHFFTAKSFSLQDALNLTDRPILHCSTLAILICNLILVSGSAFGISWLYKFGWILTAAFLSHHIRDGTRRGLWIWPFGSTKPIPYYFYIVLEILLPNIISICPLSINRLGYNECHSSFNV